MCACVRACVRACSVDYFLPTLSKLDGATKTTSVFSTPVVGPSFSELMSSLVLPRTLAELMRIHRQQMREHRWQFCLTQRSYGVTAPAVDLFTVVVHTTVALPCALLPADAHNGGRGEGRRGRTLTQVITLVHATRLCTELYNLGLVQAGNCTKF